jgi:hypothetical protein
MRSDSSKQLSGRESGKEYEKLANKKLAAGDAAQTLEPCKL